MEEEEEPQSSHPLHYCALVDLPDSLQDFRDYYSENCPGVRTSSVILDNNPLPAPTAEISQVADTHRVIVLEA